MQHHNLFNLHNQDNQSNSKQSHIVVVPLFVQVFQEQQLRENAARAQRVTPRLTPLWNQLTPSHHSSPALMMMHFPIKSHNDEDFPTSAYHDPTISEIQSSSTITQPEQLHFTTTPSDDTIPSQQNGTIDCHSAGQADDYLLEAYEGAMTTLNDRGLSLSLFSCEDQIDLPQTLNNLVLQ